LTPYNFEWNEKDASKVESFNGKQVKPTSGCD